MSARQFLAETLKVHFQPRETRPIGEWARENIILEGAENRMMAGTPYDVRNTPYNACVFDFLQDPYDRELIILKSSQIGLTLAVYIGLAWMTKYNPGNIIYCARDVLSVRELGKQRLTPIMRQVSPEFSDEISGGDQTIQVKKINGITMRLIGAQSASGFISFPCSVAALDETEVHKDLEEGSTIALTRARFKGDSDYKMIVFSKAQDEPIYETDKASKQQRLTSGQGTRTCDEYYSGTQETYHVPCPHCDHYQPLTWGQMKLDPAAIISAPGVLPVEYDKLKVEELTYQECVSCHGRILDRHKRKIVPLGRWVPAAPDQRKGPYKQAYPRRRSVHISDLYVFIFDSVHWGKLMLKWLEAQGDDEKLDAFHNDFLGLPRPERKSAGRVEISAVDRLISDYPRLRSYDSGRRWVDTVHQLHIDPLFIGLTVDKQDGYLKFVINAFMPTGEMHVLDWGSIAEEDDITHLLTNWRAKGLSGGDFAIYAGLMDCGFRRSKVIEYCLEIRGLIPYFAPARGWQRVQSRASVWVTEDTSVPNMACSIVNFDSQAWESDLYRRRIIDFDPRRPKKRYPRIHLPSDVDDDFKAELANAHQVEEVIKGRPTGVWIWTKAKDHDPNDVADCMKMGLLLWVLHAPEEGGDEPPEEGEAPD